MTTFFPCFDCGSRLFLIRGSCEFCEPELHAEYRKALAAVGDAMRRFSCETGRDPLLYYGAFERWCTSKMGGGL